MAAYFWSGEIWMFTGSEFIARGSPGTGSMISLLEGSMMRRRTEGMAMSETATRARIPATQKPRNFMAAQG
jgi:hypothetical protein